MRGRNDLPVLGEDGGENNKNLVYPEHYESLRSILKNNSLDSLLSYASNDWFDEELDCFFSHKSNR